MAVTIARLRELIALAASEGVGGIDVVEDGTRIRIARTGAAPVRAGLAAEPKRAPSTAVEHDVFTRADVRRASFDPRTGCGVICQGR